MWSRKPKTPFPPLFRSWWFITETEMKPEHYGFDLKCPKPKNLTLKAWILMQLYSEIRILGGIWVLRAVILTTTYQLFYRFISQWATRRWWKSQDVSSAGRSGSLGTHPWRLHVVLTPLSHLGHDRRSSFPPPKAFLTMHCSTTGLKATELQRETTRQNNLFLL